MSQCNRLVGESGIFLNGLFKNHAQAIGWDAFGTFLKIKIFYSCFAILLISSKRFSADTNVPED